MEEERPNYYAVIPASVRYSNVTANAKLLYGEITALANKTGACFATNKYFANLYGVSIISISKWIKELSDAGFIRTEMTYKDDTKEIDKRLISIADNNLIGIEEKFNTPIKENLKGGIKENLKGGIKEKFKDNNTDINTTSINKKENKKKETEQLIKEELERCQMYGNWESVINTFIDYRIERKKPLTSKGMVLMVRKLKELTGGDIYLAEQIIEQSIINGWQGLFPLQNNKVRDKGKSFISDNYNAAMTYDKGNPFD